MFEMFAFTNYFFNLNKEAICYYINYIFFNTNFYITIKILNKLTSFFFKEKKNEQFYSTCLLYFDQKFSLSEKREGNEISLFPERILIIDQHA